MMPRNRVVPKLSIKSKQLPTIVQNKSLRSIPRKTSKACPVSDVGSSIGQTTINEDEIETMVQMKAQTRKKHELNFQEDLIGRVKPLVNNLVTQVATNNKFQDQMSPEFTEELINSLQGLFLHMMRGGLEKQVPNTPQIERSTNNSRINITKADNTKLILIKDESIVELNETLGTPKRIICALPTEEIIPDVIIATNSLNSETIQINCRKNNIEDEITIGNVNFDKKCLTNVLTYRNKYIRFTQQNPLYRKGTGCITPWDLGLWISDQLLNSSIEAILLEMNNIDLPHTVYLHEFQ